MVEVKKKIRGSYSNERGMEEEGKREKLDCAVTFGVLAHTLNKNIFLQFTF